MSPRQFAGLLFALLVLVAAPAGAADAEHMVRADGKRLLAPDGTVLAVKGINLGNWLMPEGYMFKFELARSPRQIDAVVERLLGPDGAAMFWQDYRRRYITEDDIRFIKSVGFNTVRVPLHYRLFVSNDDPPRFAGEGYALLDRLLAWCKAAGLYVILDMHAAPGGQTGVNHDDGPGYPLLFYVPAHQRLTAKLWQHLAARYAHETAVLGYDLLNEPISPYHDLAYLNPRLQPIYERLTAAIRAVDPHHVIILAGGQWSSTFAMFGPPFADNLAFTYHKFWSTTGRDAVQPYLNYADAYNVPVLLGESGESDDAWVAKFRRLNDRYGIGWVFWTFKNLDSPSTVASIARPADWDRVLAYANQPPSAWPSGAETSAAARQALADYLDGLALAKTRINWSYLEALGLDGPAMRERPTH